MSDTKTTTVSQDFDKLTESYRKMIQTLLEGLAPGVPQTTRNVLRTTFQTYLDNTPGQKPQVSKAPPAGPQPADVGGSADLQ